MQGLYKRKIIENDYFFVCNIKKIVIFYNYIIFKVPKYVYNHFLSYKKYGIIKQREYVKSKERKEYTKKCW